MKLLHTADWHIGQTFFEYDRKFEHLAFLSWLDTQIEIHIPDLLLIAGDIFDTPNPSADSQKVFYKFLKEITTKNKDLQIIIIAGNHDSAARLEAPNPLLEEMNITIRGLVKRNLDDSIDYTHFIIPLRKGGYCLAVPYLRQGDYPQSENYAQGVQKMYEMLYTQVKDKPGPVIAMGHLQTLGAQISDNDRSERIIGGLECVSPNAFSQNIAYTALGHLHRAQRVSGRDNLRYAGSPLPMSFAERNNKQSITLVDINPWNTQITPLFFESPVQLLSLSAHALPLPEVLTRIAQLPEGPLTSISPYLEITILITEPEPSLRYQIEEALKHKSVRLARLTSRSPYSENKQEIKTYDDLQTLSPMVIANDFFKHRYGGEDMPNSMKILLQGVIQEIQ
ncbi:MAG: exonuclease SbcCD subunit D C-terminal domain-containing protein [Bacteroidales bacterium]